MRWNQYDVLPARATWTVVQETAYKDLKCEMCKRGILPTHKFRPDEAGLVHQSCYLKNKVRGEEHEKENLVHNLPGVNAANNGSDGRY